MAGKFNRNTMAKKAHITVVIPKTGNMLIHIPREITSANLDGINPCFKRARKGKINFALIKVRKFIYIFGSLQTGDLPPLVLPFLLTNLNDKSKRK